MDEQVDGLAAVVGALEEAERVAAEHAHGTDREHAAVGGGDGEELFVLLPRLQTRDLEEASAGSDGEDDLGRKEGTRRPVGELQRTDGALAHDDAGACEVEVDLVRGAAEEERDAEKGEDGRHDRRDESLLPPEGERRDPENEGDADDHPAGDLDDFGDDRRPGADATRPHPGILPQLLPPRRLTRRELRRVLGGIVGRAGGAGRVRRFGDCLRRHGHQADARARGASI